MRLLQFTVPWRQEWDADRMIGLLYSTSFGVRRLLGDRVGEFEGEMREAILQEESTGRCTTDEEIGVLIGTKDEERTRIGRSPVGSD